MKNSIVITALLVAGLGASARADDASPLTSASSDGSSQAGLDQRVAQLESDLQALHNVSGTPVTVYADPVRGLRFANADGTYGLQFSGLFQEDSRTYVDDGLNYYKGYTVEQPNEFVDARSRLIVDALLGPRVKLRYQEDFSNNGSGAILLDAYADLKLAPWANLRVGQFKTPLDIERWRLTPALDFIQYSYTAGLVTDRSQGAELEIADPSQIVYLSGGAFDGDTDAGSTPVVQAYNSDKDAIAKIFIKPFRALDRNVFRDFGFGASGSAGNHTNAPEQAYKSEGQLSIFTLGGGANTNASFVDGAGYRLIPQAYWFWKNLDVIGEYVHDSQEYRYSGSSQNVTAVNEAWQVQGAWVITGEKAGYDGFKLDGNSFGAGALQLLARVQGVDYAEGDSSVYNDGTLVFKRLYDPASSVSGLKSFTLGLNYVPVNPVKILVDWDQTEFENGGLNQNAQKGHIVVNRPTEEILQVRAQVAF
jgi:phosphate-selective porin OprO/OprP